MTTRDASEDRAVDLIFSLECVLRLDLDRHRLGRKDVLTVLGVVAATFLSEIPMRAEREQQIVNLFAAIRKDVQELTDEKIHE